MTIETKNDSGTNNGDGVEVKGSAGGTETGKEVSELETLKAEFAKVKAKNDEILAEKKSLAKKLADIEAVKATEVKSEAEKARDFEKLYQIVEQEKNELKNKMTEIETKEAEMSKKVLREKQISEFKNQLGAELLSDDFLKLVEWEKFIVDPSAGDSIKFNQDGVKQAVESFKQKYGSSVLKTSNATQQEASKGKTQKTESFAERAKKAGLV